MRMFKQVPGIDHVMCMLVIHVSYEQMYRTIDTEGFFHDYMKVKGENKKRTMV